MVLGFLLLLGNIAQEDEGFLVSSLVGGLLMGLRCFPLGLSGGLGTKNQLGMSL